MHFNFPGSGRISASVSAKFERIDGSRISRKRPSVRKDTLLCIISNVNFSLSFTAENVHFPNGELRLQCIAEIAGVWRTHVEGVALGGSKESESVISDGPNRLLIRNAGWQLVPMAS